MLACALAQAAAYTAHDVRRRAVTSPHVSLFVHVESPVAEAAHEMKESKVVVMQGSSHTKMQGGAVSSHNTSQKGGYEGRFSGEDAAETGLLRAPTQQELEMAHMKEMQALQILQDPDLRAAAEQTSQLIQAAMQDVNVDDIRELGQDRPTDTCDVCGKNSDGVSNCCSKGGSWQDTCKDLASEGGPHTWIDGFNACKEEVTQAEKDEQDEAERQRELQQKENEKHDAEQKELKAQQKKDAAKKKEDDAAATKNAIATHAVHPKKSKPKSLYPNRVNTGRTAADGPKEPKSATDHSGDADESSIQIKGKTKEADADELTGEADTEQRKYLKASKQDSMEDAESEEIVTEESGKDEVALAKEMAKESSIDITLSDEDLENGSGSGEPLSAEDANLSPDERAAERYEEQAKAEAEKAAEAARQEWEQQAKEQQEADDDLSPDEKAALQYEAEEAAEAAAKASLEAAGIDPEEEKRRTEKKAKKKAQAEIEAGQIAAPSKEEMDVARAASIVREAADKAFAERQANAKIAAEAAKTAHQALQDEEADEGLLRAPTKQELEVAAQQAAQQASADSAREEAGMLRPPTPEELTAAARVKTAEGNTSEAEELMKAAKEAREKLGQQAVDEGPEPFGALRAATPEELAKAAAGDKKLAPVTPEQQEAATKAAEKVAAQQAVQEEEEEQQQAQQQQKQQQQAAQAAAGLVKQQQADTAFASLTPSDEKQEMAFGDFMKAQKKKEKLDYDPNDGLITNEPRVPKQKDDLATKVAEMNMAAEERHKADQADDLETGQLRTATDSEAAHAAKTGEGGETQQQDDGAVPDRIKSTEAGIDKAMKDGGMKNTDRTAADGSENPDADARGGQQQIKADDLPGAEGQAARAAEDAGMISERSAQASAEVQLMREQPPS